MVQKAQNELSAVMAALWLRGAPRSCSIPNGRWPAVLRALRSRTGDPVTVIREAGFWLEATALESSSLLDWAYQRVEREECLTVASPSYPTQWLSVLRERAPAAVWAKGDLSLLGRSSWISVVGSRFVPPSVRRFARSVGEEASGLGYGIVSGRADGCDTYAASGSYLANGSVVEVLPCGLALACGRPLGVWLSVCAPDQDFSRGTAMERNALIYAFGEASVVCHARYKEGGTWHGSVDALRRRLTKVVVREDGSPACRALMGLGAKPLSRPEDLVSILEEKEAMTGLFSLG